MTLTAEQVIELCVAKGARARIANGLATPPPAPPPQQFPSIDDLPPIVFPDTESQP
ncbi:MAG: hypothetical protein V4718_04190 [Pseudomonadota bacterium]